MTSLVTGVIIWGRILNVYLFSFSQEETHYTAVFIHLYRTQKKLSLKGQFYYIIETVFKISLFFDYFIYI